MSLQAEKRNEEATQRIAKQMLQGYTLTANTCQQASCSLPMLRFKGVVQCPCCDIEPVIPAIDDEVILMQAANTNFVRNDVEVKQFDENTNPQPNRENVSKKLGKYLLQGWMMMDSTCKHCSDIPLMKNLNTNEFLCVGCEGDGISGATIESKSKESDFSYLDDTNSLKQGHPEEKKGDDDVKNALYQLPSKINNTYSIEEVSASTKATLIAKIGLLNENLRASSSASDIKLNSEAIRAAYMAYWSVESS